MNWNDKNIYTCNKEYLNAVYDAQNLRIENSNEVK